MKFFLLAVLFTGCSAYLGREQENFEAFVAEATLNTNSVGIVNVLVLRWTPNVIAALANERARKEHWTKDQEDSYRADLTQEHYGQGDSTTFLISLVNTQWPCQSPMIVSPGGIKPLIPASMMPCVEIPIADIYRHIWMENETGEKLKPLFVTKPRHETLTTEEWIWTKFHVGSGTYNWMRSSKELTFVIDIKPETIRLPINP